MNNGTHEGNDGEISFVSDFNLNKSRYDNYLSELVVDYSNVWMVRVTTKQESLLSKRKVYTRADCYLALINSDISLLLKKNNFYLSEQILEINDVAFKKIPYSGISIKMTNSSNFQIIKFGPDSFKELFHSYELGAGASLYCKNDNDLDSNLDVISGWKTDADAMAAEFHEFTKGNLLFYKEKDICQKIKSYSCDIITKKILSSLELQRNIFNGIGLYKEPYTAHFFYHGKNITKLSIIPFYVTTGSGRSKGEYTIVLKPSGIDL